MQVKGIIESVLGIARRECKRLLENRIYMFCMVVFPIAVTLFFTSLMGEGQPEKMPIGIVDLDNSTTTRRLTRMLDSFQSTEVVKHYANFEEARSAMQRNEIYGFVLYPEGTTSQLLASRQPKISFYYSYASLTAGALVFRDMKTAATLGSAAVGKSVMTAKGCTQEQIMAYLQPIVIDLHMISNPWVNYNIYLSTMLVPGCLLLFIFLITAYSFGTELKNNTARELMQRAHGNAFLAMTGKLLPQTLIFLAVMFTYMYYLFGVARLPPSGRNMAHHHPRNNRSAGFAGTRTVLLRHDAVTPNVDEHLLVVGRTELLARRFGFSCHGNGRRTADNLVPFPTETLLHHISGKRVQRIPAARCSDKSGSPCSLRTASSRCIAAFGQGSQRICLPTIMTK